MIEAGAPHAQNDHAEVLARLARRLPAEYLRRRIAIEEGREEDALTRNRFFQVDSWRSFHAVVRTCLRLSGLYWRGLSNAARVTVRENEVKLARLPAAFDGLTLLQLSDLHVDISPRAMQRVIALLPGLRYDLCVLTGDYRGANYGSAAETIAGLAAIRALLSGPVYGVLGNHDPIAMLPELEAMGIAMLVNESTALTRGEAKLHLAGIDDGHFFGTHDLAAARAAIPDGDCAILLSHTPETYAEAAAAGFDLMLCGHTHGGQICLPGGSPVTLDAPGLPRAYGAGAWRHDALTGYTSRGVGTSLVPVRFNCPPEIVLHRVRRM